MNGAGGLTLSFLRLVVGIGAIQASARRVAGVLNHAWVPIPDGKELLGLRQSANCTAVASCPLNELN